MIASSHRGGVSAAVHVLPDSLYSAICVVVARGYLDDPPSGAGLAHLFEHVWFAHGLDAPTVEWGETREHAVVLHHVCPPDEVPAVVSALARRLHRCRAAPPEAMAPRVAAALKLIALERRTGRERRVFGFPRRDIARALRGDPDFDPVAVDTDGLRLDGITSFLTGHRLAVCVAGPQASPSPGELLAAFAVPTDQGGTVSALAPALTGGWSVATEDVEARATAWLLPSTVDVAAAAWLATGLIERCPPPAGLRWVSGRVVSPFGTAAVRGGHLFAVAAGLADGPAADLVHDHLLPLLRGDLAQFDAVRAATDATRIEATDQAAIDAIDLIGPAIGHDAVRQAVREASTATMRDFAELLATSPHAEFRAHAGSRR
ncbi:hypothetical protein FHR32_008056 [Streptosporangium album]|uniref:Uncharacterized protein n=1 Tax=Streptosporangium album TaxID=47479 RepID=A0A7W7S4B3_9ACTN|nr:hypothetical protein [Streptosporangium album]MBB4943656.1 hypothetical protein [Streptosporangium album]